MAHHDSSRRKRARRQPRGTIHHFPAGTELFSSAHPADRLYRLDAGSVRIARDEEVILDYLRPGEFFGEQCLLALPEPRQAAKTVSPATVTAFSKPQLRTLLRHDRRFASGLLSSLAARIGRYEQALSEFVTEHAERRLALLLRRLAPARPITAWVQLPIPLTNRDLARMIGTTRWRVSHLLSRFRRLGFLRRQKDTLFVGLESLDRFLASSARLRSGGQGDEPQTPPAQAASALKRRPRLRTP